jgi:hypothetical protein
MAKPKKQKNPNKYFAILIIILLTLAIVVYQRPLGKKAIPTTFILSDTPGLGHVEGELMLGAIQKDHSGTREINISNDFNKRIMIKIKSKGEISDNIIVSENSFYLNPNEQKTITITAFTSGLTEYKEYSGEIIILSLRA